jgi:hypothetical protein
MANTTSGAYIFDKDFSIDEIIEEAYERIGLQSNSGYDIKTGRRSLNIMFQEWGNRGLNFWEVQNNSFTLVQGQIVYNFYRSPTDGTSEGVFNTLSSAIDASVTIIPLNSLIGFPTSGTILIGSEQINYTGQDTDANTLTGAARGANGTSAASHADDATVYDYNSIIYGYSDILEASYRNNTSVDFPLTKIDRSYYQGLSAKNQQGTPTQYFVQRFIDRVTITLYLAPGASEAGNTVNYYFVKRIQDSGVYTNATDVPYRFVPCMCSGLAYYLAIKKAPQRVQELKLLYEDELQRALEEDGSSSSSFITPQTYYPGV